MSAIDLTGQKFGNLTVVRRTENKKDGSAQWLCRCDCDNPKLIIAVGTSLRAGHKKSCGCLSRLIDLTGMTYGRLTVVKRGENSKQGQTRWYCRCSCGNPEMILVAAGNLTSGQSRSCGCLRRELSSQRIKGLNDFEVYEDIVVGYTRKREPFYCDRDDFEKIKDIYWQKSAQGYIVGRCGDAHSVLMHRLILDVNESEVVDHINHDKADNRKNNLRCVNQSQNMQNSKLSSANKSGVTGVSWFSRDQKWRASITKDYKAYNLGVYGTIAEATAARKEAEEKYFGEYSYDNSMAASPLIEAAG